MQGKKAVVVGIIILIGILIFLTVGTRVITDSLNQMNEADRKLWDTEVSLVQKTLNYNAVYAGAGLSHQEFKSLDYACEHANSVIHKMVETENDFSCKKLKDKKTYEFTVIGMQKFEGVTAVISCTNQGCKKKD